VDADVVPASALPLDLKQLAAYDATVLVDVPLPGLPQGGQEVLETYVRDLGRGLVVVGGEESYGAGGYSRSILERMLPMTMDLPSQLEIPAVGMVLVIDRSGSMQEPQGGGRSGGNVIKIELAKEAAYQAVTQLNARDSVGVVTFDTEAAWVVPMQKLGDPNELAGKIATIGPGGGTYIYAGLDTAVQGLEKSTARGKHIVLLTDGVSMGGDYEGLLKRMEAAHMTLSTVGLGSDVDAPFLSALATRGGGRFYNTQDAGSLPAIFAHESHIASRAYLIEHPFTPKRTAPSPILQDIAEMPALQGYVGTTVRPAAVLALVSDAGDPVLAHWQYGLGRVAAWTSDAKGRWAAGWVGWSGFPTFWGAAARWAMGTDNGGGLQARVDLQDNEAHVSLDAVTGGNEPINGLRPVAVAVLPASAGEPVSHALSLRQTAPGHYEGRFPVSAEGTYLVRVQANSGNGTPPAGAGGAQTVGLVVPYSPEYRALPGNNGLLERLTAATGGQALGLDAAGATAIFRHDLPSVSRAIDLAPWLLLLALLLLPLDIGARRVLIGWRDLPRLWGELAGRLVPPSAPAVPSDAAATAALGPLFEARRRAEGRVRSAGAAEIAARLERQTRAAQTTAPPDSAGPQPLAGGQSGVQLAGRSTEMADPPAESPPKPQTAPGNLAAEVLRRRRERG
ncbi:MAG TPA: VWA domain-containing protein, partial [Chloroflexia bacterium]|nr:VWA domain-containing protein [Chloroflexia bacterium]